MFETLDLYETASLALTWAANNKDTLGVGATVGGAAVKFWRMTLVPFTATYKACKWMMTPYPVSQDCQDILIALNEFPRLVGNFTFISGGMTFDFSVPDASLCSVYLTDVPGVCSLLRALAPFEVKKVYKKAISVLNKLVEEKQKNEIIAARNHLKNRREGDNLFHDEVVKSLGRYENL
jgi:hypothetical protein